MAENDDDDDDDDDDDEWKWSSYILCGRFFVVIV